MPEILTESFCERCGTRYTFESTAPKARLGRFKTLSKGLRNFVLDDATSLDEALAAARNDENRESTAQQLDAFHKTFNFCMSCRQYTCANCWNEAEGQCLTCSPAMGRGLSGAWAADAGTSPAWPAQALERPGLEAVAWPSVDRRPSEPQPAPVEEPWPLAALEGRVPVVEPEPVEDVEPEPEPIAAEPEPVGEDEPLVAAEAAPMGAGSPTTLEERAAAAAANTADLLARFRPGQSLDEALAAYEASLDTAPPAAPLAEVEPEFEPEPLAAEPAWPEPVAAEPAWPEPVAAEPEPAWAQPEPAWAQPEPAWPEAEPEPVAATSAEPIPWPLEPAFEPQPTAEPEPEPAWVEPEPDAPAPEPPSPWVRGPRPAEDIVEVPTWHVVAPDSAPVNGHPSEALRPAAQTERPLPQWPGQSAESFLAARLAARKAGDDMWAASSVDVVRPGGAPGAAAPIGVQACVSCGLSLSATARFCRRCGTRQG